MDYTLWLLWHFVKDNWLSLLSAFLCALSIVLEISKVFRRRRRRRQALQRWASPQQSKHRSRKKPGGKTQRGSKQPGGKNTPVPAQSFLRRIARFARPSGKKPKQGRSRWKTQQAPNHCMRLQRKVLNKSQEAMAEEIGVDPVTYGRWERGETRPHKSNLPHITRVLGMSAEELNLEAATRRNRQGPTSRKLNKRIQQITDEVQQQIPGEESGEDSA